MASRERSRSRDAPPRLRRSSALLRPLRPAPLPVGPTFDQLLRNLRVTQDNVVLLPEQLGDTCALQTRRTLYLLKKVDTEKTFIDHYLAAIKKIFIDDAKVTSSSDDIDGADVDDDTHGSG